MPAFQPMLKSTIPTKIALLSVSVRSLYWESKYSKKDAAELFPMKALIPLVIVSMMALNLAAQWKKIFNPDIVMDYYISQVRRGAAVGESVRCREERTTQHPVLLSWLIIIHQNKQ